MRTTIFKCVFFLFVILKVGYSQSTYCADPISQDSMTAILYRMEEPKKTGEAIKSFGLYHIEIQATNLPNDCGIGLFITNWSDTSFGIKSHSEVYLPIICEAKNSIGRWKPIEYRNTFMCDFGRRTILLEPTKCLPLFRPNYTGDFNTKIRFKFQDEGFVFISNTLRASINKGQFKKVRIQDNLD